MRAIGVDEAGRGSLVGSVVAAAVVLPSDFHISGLTDSKKLSEKKRDALYRQITQQCEWSVSEASNIEIDQFNVLQATMLAMKRAIIKLKTKPKIVLIDGNKSPKIKNYFIKTVIKGDQKIPEISAASIIAKVSRDKLITDISKKFKSYKWHLNAGYGTKEHLRAIKKFGITKFHRKTFKPIHNILSLNKSK